MDVNQGGMELVTQQSPVLQTKAVQQVRQRFAENLRRAINGVGGAANFLSLLMEKSNAVTDVSSAAGGESAEADSSASATAVQALERCAVILRKSPDTQRSLMQLFNQASADCTSLSPSSPIIQFEAEQVVWLQFRRVLESNPAVNLGVSDFVESVRSGQCVLFHPNTDENTIVESLFPDYKYLIVNKGAEKTAEMLPELFDVRQKTSERINTFHKTAGSDDCKVVEVDGPKVEVRKELKELEARKLHIVTKDLIDELYEFYRLEMLSGVRATTGAAHVPNHEGCDCCASHGK